jgi:hypothetical protein
LSRLVESRVVAAALGFPVRVFWSVHSPTAPRKPCPRLNTNGD